MTDSSGADGPEGVDTPGRRFFVVRIMKTASTTLVGHARSTFHGPRDVYPTGGIDSRPGDLRAALSIPHLLDLPSERKAETRVFIGHFPYIAYQMLGIDCVTVTVLRDPVARIASHLRQAKSQAQFKDLPIEAIYEDPFVFSTYLHNHQTKNFAMTSDDPLKGIRDVIDIDDQRLALAMDNLERVDVLGFTEQFGELLDELHMRFGWTIERDLVTNVSTESWEPTAALRKTIVADNLADVEFYEFAKSLQQRRRRSSLWLI